MDETQWLLVVFFWGPAFLALIAGIVYSLFKWTRQPQAKVDVERVKNWGCLPAVLLFIIIIAFVFLFGTDSNDATALLVLISWFSAFCVYFFWNVGVRMGAWTTEIGRVPLTFLRERGGVGITVGLGIIATFILIVLTFIVLLIVAGLNNCINEFIGGSSLPPY